MNNETNTTGESPITLTDEPNALTIRIAGAALDNLRKIADAMNGVEWCDNDNTPSSILEDSIIGHYLRVLEEPTVKYGNYVCGGVGEIACFIVDGIDTLFKSGTPEDKARKDELHAALVAAGVI